jgi:hypothetical protein
MRTSNIFGMAYHFLPRDISNRSTGTEVSRGTSLSTSGNVIYFMSGTMPDADTLYEIGDVDTFETNFAGQISGKISGLTFVYSYDKRNKERVIRKTPVDALHWTMTSTGIGWFAVKLTDVDTSVSGEDTMFFSDSIGEWNDTERAIIIESKTAISGQENIFKDFVLSIQDGLKSELA